MPDGVNVGGAVIAVCGPTAVGKTELAERLAVRTGGEVVSADSMQVYRGMDVGTAKQPVASRRVPYHCIDLVEPGEPYSAARYQSDARAAIDGLRAAGRRAVVCGGTGLYLRAALDEMSFPSGMSGDEVRARLEAEAAALGGDELHRRLAAADPESAALIHPNNVRRTVRALEMHAVGGTSYAQQAAGFSRRRSHYPTVWIALTADREVLYDRIDRRVRAMVEAGLLDEVRSLLAAGYRDALTATQAIGYKELVPVLEDGHDLEQAVEEIARASRRYAKRQLTWLRADPRVNWVDVTGSSPSRVEEQCLALVESADTTGA